MSGDKWAGLLRCFEIAGVLVRFDHVARCIVKANHGIVKAVRVEPDTAWLTIKRPGAEADYIEVEDRGVSALVAKFQAIGISPELTGVAACLTSFLFA